MPVSRRNTNEVNYRRIAQWEKINIFVLLLFLLLFCLFGRAVSQLGSQAMRRLPFATEDKEKIISPSPGPWSCRAAVSSLRGS